MTEAERSDVERACLRLVHSYAYCADFGDFDAAAAQYADDGSLELAGKVVSGRDAIRERLAQKPDAQVSRHVCSNTLVEALSDDRARGVTYVTLYRADRKTGDAGPLPLAAPFIVGHYEDEFRRTADGWRFAKRKLVTTFRRAEPA